MASVAFAIFTKTAAGAGIGTAGLIGGGIMAAFIDQNLILPALFPVPNNAGPKFDDTGLQSASEGVPINRCYGLASRMSGQVIWAGDLTEIETLAATTGKGGGFQVSTTEYKRDVAVAFCGNEVKSVDRIHADGKLLWTLDPSKSYSGTDISADPPLSSAYLELRKPFAGGFEELTFSTLYTGQAATVDGFPKKGTFVSSNGAGANVLFFKGAVGAGSTTVIFDADGSTLTGTILAGDGFIVAHGGSVGQVGYVVAATQTLATGGTSVTIHQKKGTLSSGLAAAVADGTQVTVESGNNGTFQVQSTGIDYDGAYEWVRLAYSYPQTFAAGDSVTVSQTGVNFDPAKVDSVTVYTGTDYQDPDPTMEAALGVGQVPAYRGRTYVVFEGLVLTDYGNRIPNFTARCTASNAFEYGQAIGEMLDEAGLDPDEYDVSGLDSVAPGYYAQGPLTTSQRLQPYLISGELLAREAEAVLQFYTRAAAPTVTIDEAHLGAYAEGGTAEYPAKATDRDDLKVPNAVTVTFLDPAKDYQAGSVTEKAPGVASSTSAQVRVPLSLTTAEARDMAQHALYNARTNRHGLVMTLPPSYIGDGITENMLASVTTLGEDWTILTQRVDVGTDWLVEVEGVREDTSVAEFAESDSAPLDVPATSQIQTAPALRFQVMDIAPLSDDHAGRLGFYVAASSLQANRWRGAVLFGSSDAGASYKRVADVSTQAVMGFAQDALADGPVGHLDRAATVTVQLDSGELESVSYADALKGANRIWLGGEIVGFTTATLVGTRTYTLSGLLRGLRDTRGYTGSHAAGEAVVVLGGGVQFVETNSASVGVLRSFKVVANGGTVSDENIVAQSVRLVGRTMMPFAPVHIAGTRDGSDNLTLTWTRRSRRLVDILGDTRAASADVDAAHGYEVDVVSAGSVLRTITSATETAAYSAADQTTDGLTPGDPVTVRVYGVSEVVGRGNYTEETV